MRLPIILATSHLTHSGPLTSPYPMEASRPQEVAAIMDDDKEFDDEEDDDDDDASGDGGAKLARPCCSPAAWATPRVDNDALVALATAAEIAAAVVTNVAHSSAESMSVLSPATLRSVLALTLPLPPPGVVLPPGRGWLFLWWWWW